MAAGPAALSASLLISRYEQLRDAQLHGANNAPFAGTILLRQGLAAWITLVATEQAAAGAAHDVAVPSVSSPTSVPFVPFLPSPAVRSELLAALTDLVVGALTTQEVS